MMFCKKATALLTEADEGALEGATKGWFGLHLTVCAPCRRYRRQLEATKATLRNLPREQPSPALLAVLASELEKKT
jgi:hypothetical protein